MEKNTRQKSSYTKCYKIHHNPSIFITPDLYAAFVFAGIIEEEHETTPVDCDSQETGTRSEVLA